MKTIRLKNYRCFEDTGYLELAPITFLVGANSSGKSSLLKLFPLIKQSMWHRRKGLFLWNSEGGVDFDSFTNTMKDSAEDMVLEFGLDNFMLINNRQKITNRRSSKNSTFLNISITLVPNMDNKDVFKSILLTFDDQEIELCFENHNIVSFNINGNKISDKKEVITCAYTNSLLPHLIFEKGKDMNFERSSRCDEILYSFIYEREENLTLRGPKMSQIRTLNSDLLGSKDYIARALSQVFDTNESYGDYDINTFYLWYNINRIIDSINTRFLSLASNISYIQPLRAMAQRYYRLQNLWYEEISSDGTNLAMYLYNLPKGALDRFRNWLMGLFKFDIDLKPSEGHIQIMINPKYGSQRNMVDVGFGYSQILPILAIIWNAIEEPIKSSAVNGDFLYDNRHIIVIEQPELHLHPRFINVFASMLAKVISMARSEGKNLKLIIETHSETLINKVGELIADGSKGILNKEVSVLLFNVDEYSCKHNITKSYFSEDGYLLNWPYGFFSGDWDTNDYF